MNDVHDKINIEFQQGVDLKEEARKATNQLDKYKLAAEHFDNAAILCNQVISDIQYSKDDKTQAEVFHNYHLSEKYSCLFSYFYENHLIDEANTNQIDSINYIKEAIRIIRTQASSCNIKTQEYLNSFLDSWMYILKAKEAEKYSPDARKYWNEGKLVEALDCYRKMTTLQKEAIELAKVIKVNPAYERIAMGNYIGMMANMSSTLARVFFKKSSDSSPKQISRDDALELVRHTLEAARLSRLAYENNPEWEQYIEGAKAMEQNVIDFLNDNPHFWAPMIINFENSPEVLSFMKKVDIKKYRQAEANLYFSDNKIGKLWAFGSFWIVVLLIISALVVFIIEKEYAWWQLLITFIFIETIFVIIGAFVLRAVGDLSEESFVQLIKESLSHQFHQFKMILRSNKM